jgi:hypothetical protein
LLSDGASLGSITLVVAFAEDLLVVFFAAIVLPYPFIQKIAGA